LLLYARVAGIPHTVGDVNHGQNSKGKAPYIVHGGKVIADSQLIIRYFENSFDLVAMAKKVREPQQPEFVPFCDLSPEDQAKSDAVRILCETEIYWSIASIRWLGVAGITQTESSWHTTVEKYFGKLPAALRFFLVPWLRVTLARDAYGYGFARHSPKDQIYLAKRAIKALSVLLGREKFFLGSNIVSEVDCVAHAMIENISGEKDAWPNALSEFIISECKNLVEFEERVKGFYCNDLDPKKLDVPPGCDRGEIILKKQK